DDEPVDRMHGLDYPENEVCSSQSAASVTASTPSTNAAERQMCVDELKPPVIRPSPPHAGLPPPRAVHDACRPPMYGLWPVTLVHRPGQRSSALATVHRASSAPRR